MNTLKLTKITLGSVAALILAAGAQAQMGQKNGTEGMMQCGMKNCCMRKAPTAPLASQSVTKNSLNITAKLASPASSGDNALDIVVKSAAGKPITAAKVTTQVAMTSMDMGTTSPTVKETGKGHYSTTVNFSMSGPWRITVKVVAPGQKPQTKAFDFMAN